MIRFMLKLLGYKISYIHPWGIWDRRYSTLDHTMNRPIHRNMSVAPPGAKMVIVKM